MKKFLSFALATVISAAMLTSCGSAGESNAEDAAKAYATALVEHDVDAAMSLIPDDVIDYLDEEYSLSEETIEKSIDTIMDTLYLVRGDEIDDIKKDVKKAKVDSKNERDIDYVRELSESIGVSAEAYVFIELDCELDCNVYKYDGEWYSSDLIFDVMNMAEIDY